MSFLPLRDREYLESRGIQYEEIDTGGHKAIRIKSWQLPSGKYSAPAADVLILLPAGYPDIQPDMFYTSPWLQLSAQGRYPKAADQPLSLAGVSWQRWSRHASEWRPGRDG